jgi:iron only hydrogenase large subunit-like protein/nitrogen-specific signal transduction histidine kinase
MSVVTTIEGKCRRCYSCIMNCPASAIRVEKGQSKVIEERCIGCGNCLRVCIQKAKKVEDGILPAEKLLLSGEKVIACLAPSFPAAFPDIKAEQLIGSLKTLGFEEVIEVAYGAELVVASGYTELLKDTSNHVWITSPCPALVNYIEKYEPELIKNIAPIVSPMIALGRYIKKYYDSQARLIFIGPCIAKKMEIKDPNVAGVIDTVLTFKELKEMFLKNNINPEQEKELSLDGPRDGLARLFPISGGLLRTAGTLLDMTSNEILVTEGKEKVLAIIKAIKAGKVSAKFYDLLLCDGCIDGPEIDNCLSVFERKEQITNYIKNFPVKPVEDMPDVDLKRQFTIDDKRLPVPTEEKIREILASINKTKPEDEFNCGFCGYDTCREKAIAVFQGLAENDMCLPFLIEKLELTREIIIQQEKISSIGQMAAGVAHELNNPLAGSLIYIKLLLKKLSGGTFEAETGQTYLENIEKEINRCSKIIKNLLDFARQSHPLRLKINLNEILEDSLSMMTHQAQLGNVNIDKNLYASLPFVMADPDQMRQVFINLILNAIQAMENGGNFTVTSSYIQETDEVSISFKDTGGGISKENLKKLFAPFFTTKGDKKGVGLGLAVINGIIEKHEGKIEVESDTGRGTTFTVKLEACHD